MGFYSQPEISDVAYALSACRVESYLDTFLTRKQSVKPSVAKSGDAARTNAYATRQSQLRFSIVGQRNPDRKSASTIRTALNADRSLMLIHDPAGDVKA